MRVTRYTVRHAAISAPVRIAVVADLHNGRYEEILSALAGEVPTLVAVPGDFLDTPHKTARAFAFLREVAARYPTFVSLGNHDVRSMSGEALFSALRHTGATLLQNSSVFFAGIQLGGLSTGYAHGGKQSRLRPPPAPDLAFLDRFSATEGFHLLLSHHPEYFDPYIAKHPIELILSGHAHGGQWSLGRHGLFAPGQGLFPRYTAGLYHGRLLVSRGLCRTHPYLLRIGNPRELVMLTLLPAEEKV